MFLFYIKAWMIVGRGERQKEKGKQILLFTYTLIFFSRKKWRLQSILVHCFFREYFFESTFLKKKIRFGKWETKKLKIKKGKNKTGNEKLSSIFFFFAFLKFSSLHKE